MSENPRMSLLSSLRVVSMRYRPKVNIGIMVCKFVAFRSSFDSDSISHPPRQATRAVSGELCRHAHTAVFCAVLWEWWKSLVSEALLANPGLPCVTTICAFRLSGSGCFRRRRWWCAGWRRHAVLRRSLGAVFVVFFHDGENRLADQGVAIVVQRHRAKGPVRNLSL